MTPSTNPEAADVLAALVERDRCLIRDPTRRGLDAARAAGSRSSGAAT